MQSNTAPFWTVALVALWFGPGLAVPAQSEAKGAENDVRSQKHSSGVPPTSQHRGRIFFWTEINLVGFYSLRTERVDLSPRPQRTSVGFEFAGSFEDQPIGKALFGDRLTGLDFDLHPLVILNPVDRRTKFVFHDAWIKFGLSNHPRTKFKLGHFLIPLGQNPILEPRGFFFLPLTAADLGFKRDWGLSFQSIAGGYVYEVALTAGSGLGIHRRNGSYLITGRLGTPTYKDFEYGISGLYGKIPEISAERILSNEAITRWRIGGDMIYKYGTYTLLKGEFAAGKNAEAPVLGYQVEVDYVLPRFLNWEVKAQFGSWSHDLRRSHSNDIFLLSGVAYSLTTSTTLGVNYIRDFQRRDRETEDDRIFVQLHLFF